MSKLHLLFVCLRLSGIVRKMESLSLSQDESSVTMDEFEQQRMTQEQMQKKLYFLSEHLRNFHSNLPE